MTGADEAQRFTPLHEDQSASSLFSIEPRKLALLEAESTLPGSIVENETRIQICPGLLLILKSSASEALSPQ